MTIAPLDEIAATATAVWRRVPAVIVVGDVASLPHHRNAPPVKDRSQKETSSARKLIIFAPVGSGAQLVDGAMGMGNGVTSTSLLLPPATPVVASAPRSTWPSFTNIASALTHWKLGNVDCALSPGLGFLGLPGPGDLPVQVVDGGLAPVMAAIPLALGAYILIRFCGASAGGRRSVSPARQEVLAPSRPSGGFVDATGGGG